jgi:hypothetical protein
MLNLDEEARAAPGEIDEHGKNQIASPVRQPDALIRTIAQLRCVYQLIEDLGIDDGGRTCLPVRDEPSLVADGMAVDQKPVLYH